MIQLPTIIYIYINLSQLPVLQDLHWPSCWVPALPNLEVADQTGFVKGLGTAPPTDATARWWTQLRWIDSRMSQKIEGKKWKVKPPDMYTYIYIYTIYIYTIYIYIYKIYIYNIYIYTIYYIHWSPHFTSISRKPRLFFSANLWRLLWNPQSDLASQRGWRPLDNLEELNGDIDGNIVWII